MIQRPVDTPAPEREHWYVVKVNPEPWAIGPLGVGRKGGHLYPFVGPNDQLEAYKKAVRGNLEGQKTVKVEGEVEVKFFFWRCLESYKNASGRKVNKHQADATNLQKATEDAIQDILIGNDRNVRAPSSVIMEQGPDVEGMIVICIREVGDHESEIPSHVWDKIDEAVPLPDGAVESREYIDPESVF